jgi:GNAT superfamily N-acetyltransferase
MLDTAYELSNSGDVMDDDYLPLRLHAPLPCTLGVHQIWTHAEHRGRGVATALLDAARERAVYGRTVPRDMVAFSSPTGDGARLAKKYRGGEGIVKVYGGD